MSTTTAPVAAPVTFNPWWVRGWGIVAVGLIVSVAFVPFKWWALATLVGFGTMEGIGVFVGGAYPPLTLVIRNFVPRSVAFAAIFAIAGGAGAKWFHAPHPVRVAALVGLIGWFTAHFDVQYDDQAKAEERAKYARLGLRSWASRHGR